MNMCTDATIRTLVDIRERARDRRAETMDNAPLEDAIRRHIDAVDAHVAATGCTSWH